MFVFISKYRPFRWYHNWLPFTSGRKKIIHVSDDDVWSFDDTLAPIILEGLKKLRASDHSFGNVDDVDVPKKLRATKEERQLINEAGVIDEYYEGRWHYILDEMIWAFTQKVSHDADDAYYTEEGEFIFKEYKKHSKRMEKGFRLFGKYYQALWI